MKPIYRWLVVVCLLIPFALPALGAEEFRGLYVDAFHPGFKTHEETTKMVAAAKAAHFNALIVQVRKRGDAYYNSSIEPKASDTSANYDPLADMVTQAHAAGLEVHAWISVYEVSNLAYATSDSHVCRKHPGWIMKGKDGEAAFYNGRLYLDPGIPAVTDYVLSVIRDILSRYEVDGINLDSIRYPTTEAGYSDSAIDLFNQQTGSTGVPMSDSKPWCQWRCDQITRLVDQAHRAIISTNATAKLSASVMLADPKYAADIFLQQWDVWLRDGLVDFVIPMTYEKGDSMADCAANVLKSTYARHVYMGIGAYRISQALAEKQIADCRAEGAKGVALYSYHYLCSVTSPDRAEATSLASSVFAEDADLPAMGWR